MKALFRKMRRARVGLAAAPATEEIINEVRFEATGAGAGTGDKMPALQRE